MIERTLELFPPRQKADALIRKRWEDSRFIQAGIFGAAVVIGAIAGPFLVKHEAIGVSAPVATTAAVIAERVLAVRKSDAIVRAYDATVRGVDSEKTQGGSGTTTAALVESNNTTDAVFTGLTKTAGFFAMLGLEAALTHPNIGGAEVALGVTLEGVAFLNPRTEVAITIYRDQLNTIDQRVSQLAS